MQKLGMTDAPLAEIHNTSIFHTAAIMHYIFDMLNGGKCHTGYQESIQSVRLAMWGCTWLVVKLQTTISIQVHLACNLCDLLYYHCMHMSTL